MPKKKKEEAVQGNAEDVSLESLTPEQEQEIMRTGAVSVKPESDPPQEPAVEEEEETGTPAGEEEQGDSAAEEQSIPPETQPAGEQAEIPAKQQPTSEELQAQVEKLNREKSGILGELLEEREQRRRFQASRPPVQPQAPAPQAKVDRIAELQQKMEDDDFVDGKTLKSVVNELRDLQSQEFERREQETRQAENQMAQNSLKQKMESSAAEARTKFADYDQKMAIFHEMVRQNPNYGYAMLRSENPAAEAYQLASSIGSSYHRQNVPQAPQAQAAPAQQPARKVPRMVQGSGGTAGPAKVNMERAAQMSEEEFDRLPDAEKVRLLRGF